MVNAHWNFLLQFQLTVSRPAMIHWCTGTSWCFLPWYKYRISNKLSRYLRHLHIKNMAKHCLQLVLPLLLPFTPYAQRFSKLTRKIHAEQCLALYGRWRTQQTHSCFQLGLSAVQTSEPMSKTWGKTLLVLLLCNVSCIVSWQLYRDTYRILEKCIVAGLTVSART